MAKLGSAQQHEEPVFAPLIRTLNVYSWKIHEQNAPEFVAVDMAIFLDDTQPRSDRTCG